MRLRFYPLPALVSFGGLCLGVWGCPGRLADPGEFADAGGFESGSETGSEAGGGTACAPAAVAAVPTTIFQPTCGMTGCHSPPSPEEGLDFASPGLVSRLMGVPSMEEPALSLVNPTDPTNSYILIKLSPNPPSGSQMPLALPPLSSDQVACVQAWIESVASDAGAGGAAAMDGGDSGSVPTFTQVYTTVLTANGCTTCHAGATPSGELDMSSQATAYADLVGVAATTPSGETPACSGDRVVAGSASTSLLYLKVSEATPPCGAQMPFGEWPIC